MVIAHVRISHTTASLRKRESVLLTSTKWRFHFSVNRFFIRDGCSVLLRSPAPSSLVIRIHRHPMLHYGFERCSPHASKLHCLPPLGSNQANNVPPATPHKAPYGS